MNFGHTNSIITHFVCDGQIASLSMSCSLVHHLYYMLCGGDVGWEEEDDTVLEEEAREYFLKNGFALVPKEVKSASKAKNIRDIINLDLSDSDDSSVFIPREGKKERRKEGKKEKDNKGKEKRKYFYKLDDTSSSIENSNNNKSNAQNKSKKEVEMLEKSKKDVEGY
eukprot:4626500-Ditylum_brightwellii.AAC.1